MKVGGSQVLKPQIQNGSQLFHKVGRRYVQSDEEQAVLDQTAPLGEVGGKIAKDADLLEQAFAAKEYMEAGHAAANDWIINIRKVLYTKSAKQLLEK